MHHDILRDREYIGRLKDAIYEQYGAIKLGTDYLQGYLLGRPQAAPQDVPGDIKRLIRSIAEGGRS